jgi:hypothetical protein
LPVAEVGQRGAGSTKHSQADARRMIATVKTVTGVLPAMALR